MTVEVKAEANLDVDGVLGDFLTPAMELANYMFGTNFKPEEQDQWDMVPYMGLTREQASKLFKELEQPGFHAHIKPYEGAVEGVALLKTVANIHVVTSPLEGATWCFERWKWMKRHFDIHYKDVTHSHQKHKVTGDVLIDDKPDNVTKWAHHHRDGLGILWHQHYTASIIDPPLPNVVRCRTWQHAVESIQRHMISKMQRLFAGQGA